MKKVALITGASSGIGYETAMNYKNMGYTVYGCARRLERMEGLKKQGVHCLPLDITEDASVQKCIDTIMKQEGQIDILVNNAGYGIYGPMENTPMDEVRRQFEVNYFGLANLTQHVLLHMRERRAGVIVNIASMGGRFTIPFGGWYHATKYAVESYSDSLRQEVAPFGIRVIIVEPGTIQTEWGVIAADKTRALAAGNVYEKDLNIYADYLDARYKNGHKLLPPKKVADLITKETGKRRPKTRIKAGMTAKVYILMKNILPDRAFDWMCKKSIGY